MTTKLIKADIAIIGAGSGGLSVAAGAAQLGAKVVLFERGAMGGDCLNYGCVPSKALIAAANATAAARDATRFGVTAAGVAIDFSQVMAHVRATIATIEPHDSQERFEGLGVQVIRESARFADAKTLVSATARVQARKIVIATGSSARIPDVPGLGDIPFLTNETIFDLTVLPEQLIVLGGGPIGMELGQAFQRLGSRVTVVDPGTPLGREDPAAAQVVLDQVRADGVTLKVGGKVVRVETGPVVVLEGPSGEERVSGSHLLVAVGRVPSLDGLDLAAAGVTVNDHGIETSDSLRTSNPRVYAIGDVAGRGQFTHLAGAHAGLLVRRLLFAMPVKAGALVVPRATYTSPELAAVGLSEAQARAGHGDDIRVERVEFSGNDRALAEGDTRGFGKLITTRKGKVLGAVIVGDHAGEQIQLWSLALSAGIKLSQIAGMIAPYPTRGEISKRMAGQWYTAALFSPMTRLLVGVLKRLA
ncbi:MAG: FAD-dependent oxidoreductase [Caulobacter sp.]|nr:FAD-dependent oxidoreductase [Caulobacter sp.]